MSLFRLFILNGSVRQMPKTLRQTTFATGELKKTRRTIRSEIKSEHETKRMTYRMVATHKPGQP
jgi:uncharacterized membrane protein YoaK (UPF0700 family)